MKKIEMVRVRSTPETVTEVMPNLVASMEKLKGEFTAGEVRIMQHTTYHGDISIFIFWEDNREPEKSREGLIIAEILQEIGALNHFVWLAK